MSLEILDIITKEEIEYAYDFKKNNIDLEIIAKESLRSRLKKIEDVKWDYPQAHVIYIIDIIKPDDDTILEDKFGVLGIQRELYPNKKLKGIFCRKGETILGRVFYKVSLCLKKEYREKGIGSILYFLEEKLAKKWKADEIQLYAAFDGKIRWRDKGFNIDCIDAGHIETQYEYWCRENHLEYIPLHDIKQYPREFLMSDKVRGFNMYKEL